MVQMVSNGRHSQVFIIEMIMRCGKYQIVVGHSPFLVSANWKLFDLAWVERYIKDSGVVQETRG